MTGRDIIAILKARGMTSTIRIEPYLGETGGGPKYGAPVEVEAYVKWQRTKVRNAAGDEVIASSVVYCRLSETVRFDPTLGPEKSRVTHASGRTGFIVADAPKDGAGLPTPDHLQLAVGDNRR